jgi:glycosyltransferase involved in cell wall biosynthesis
MSQYSNNPLISVVTPVYNGEKYLAQCIESVIAQSCRNWEYIIVNNCSTDGTSQLLDRYAKSDARIRIFNNETFVDAIDNHNIALRYISPDSVYCKILQADDWLYPQCLEMMVMQAQQNPSSGIIGSYVLWDKQVGCDGLPPSTQFLSGREICRLTLLKKIYPFVNLSGLMLRSDLVRARDPFLREKSLHTDVETYYELLQNCDFSFVHQVLSFVRKHEDSRSSALAESLVTYRYASLYMLVKFGPVYLSEKEFNNQLQLAIKGYYQFLVSAIWQKRSSEFWEFHKNGLKSIGYPINKTKLWSFWGISICERILKKVENLIGFSDSLIIFFRNRRYGREDP